MNVNGQKVVAPRLGQPETSPRDMPPCAGSQAGGAHHRSACHFACLRGRPRSGDI